MRENKEKKAGEEELGPRLRPVCGAEDSVTKIVSYILCLVLSRLIPDNWTQSTDDLLS